MSIYEKRHKIIGYYVIRAKFQIVSPLKIGSGKANNSERDIIRDSEMGGAYIPAAGIIGALKHRFDEGLRPDVRAAFAPAAAYFWGTDMRGNDANRNSNQSHLRLPDIRIDHKETGAEQQITVRDGVRIDPHTNTAAEGKKYDYEILEPNATFTFAPEITIREGFGQDVRQAFDKLIAWMRTAFEADFCIGGGTTRGFGRLKLIDFEQCYFDFENATDAEEWFKYLETGEGNFMPVEVSREDAERFAPAGNRFKIEATFALKSALQIGAPGRPGADSDTGHLHSRNAPVISGTSLAGAVRHRALKILHTLDVADAEDRIDQLFGFVDEDRSGKARKSRVRTHEAKISGARSQLQTRIRIDRFTGGVIRGGLFDSEPLMPAEASEVVLEFGIPSYDRTSEGWQAALLLQVLLDLWTGDLPIGSGKNIGRGVLQGRQATLWFDDRRIEIRAAADGSPEFHADDLPLLSEVQDALNTLMPILQPSA